MTPLIYLEYVYSTVYSVEISQGSPILPILYLFYNADLLKICTDIKLRTELTGFVDDVNILTYGDSMKRNCKALEQIHQKCTEWAKKHGSKFFSEKHELVHFTHMKGRIDLQAYVMLEGTKIEPKELRQMGMYDTAV
jgi:Reverse transcriptase (RNA-dependent DNA polymerase)